MEWEYREAAPAGRYAMLGFAYARSVRPSTRSSEIGVLGSARDANLTDEAAR